MLKLCIYFSDTSWSPVGHADPDTPDSVANDTAFHLQSRHDPKPPDKSRLKPAHWPQRQRVYGTSEETSFHPHPDGSLSQYGYEEGLNTEKTNLTDLETDKRKMEGEFKLVSGSEMRSELRTPSFYRDVLCEVNINFILLFIDAMIASARPDIFVLGFVSGLYVFLLIDGFGHIQGALQNPVVTLAFVCTNRLSALKGKTLSSIQYKDRFSRFRNYHY